MKTEHIKICYAAKVVFRGKFIVLNASIGKEERSQANNLSFYLKKLIQEDKNKPKLRTRKGHKKDKSKNQLN